MQIDESQIDEQIEISALTTDTLDKLQNVMQKVLVKQPDPNAFNIDADNRYADFAECISKMRGKRNILDRSILYLYLDNEDDDDDANVVDQVVSDKCPLTQKAFIEPVQNKKCKHKYEKKTVLKYIADKNKSRRPAKCPSAGCENILHEKDLINA
jgi:SUMO ligase MMS21 Smc5/6 complex component